MNELAGSGETVVAGVTSGEMGPGDTVTWRARHFGIVRFRSPLGPLGRLVDRLVLARYMPRLIRQRNDWLTAALEGRTPKI